MTQKMLLTCFIMLLVDITLSTEQQIDLDRNKSVAKVLSRKKRFLIFPTGSSFSVAVCMTVGVYGNPQFSIWSWAINYGFAYNLPTNSTYFTHPPDDLFQIPLFPEGGPPVEEPLEPETTVNPLEHHHDEHDHSFEHDHDHGSFNAPHGELPVPADSPALTMPAAQRKYFVYYQPKYETKPMLQRRYRRDVYRKIESVIDK